MILKFLKIFLICILIFSCSKKILFEKQHGRIIPDNDNYFKTENIQNKTIKLDANTYDKEILFSDDGKYIVELYTNKEIKKLERYSDDYLKILMYETNNWYSIMDVTRIYDNTKIIYGFYVNPDDTILIHNDKIYCHQMNSILELDLNKITEKSKYVYDKTVEVEINKIIGNYLMLSIKEVDFYGFWEDDYKPIQKNFKIKIK